MCGPTRHWGCGICYVCIQNVAESCGEAAVWIWFLCQGLFLAPTPRVTLGRCLVLSSVFASVNVDNRCCLSYSVAALRGYSEITHRKMPWEAEM